MATRQEDIGGMKESKSSEAQSNSESLDRRASSDPKDVDNGPNQVSNGTQSTPREPGIARVGNTSPDEEERH